MNNRMYFVVFVLLLAGSAYAATPNHAASDKPDTCDQAKQLKISDLAQNATAMSAARDLANQIVTQYNDYIGRNQGNADGFIPKIEEYTAPFSASILTVLIEPQFCNDIQSSAAPGNTSAGVAVATTSQTNKQNGPSSTASGTTSVTEKTAVTQLLGIAVQDGAINNNVTGNTMTLSTSAYGFVNGFGWIKDTANDYNTWGMFSRLGASATFNLTNPTSTTSTTTNTSSPASTTDTLASANRRQVSQWQIKFTFKDTSIRSKAVTDVFNGKKESSTTTKLKDAITNAQDRAAKSQSLRAATQALDNTLSSREMSVLLQPLQRYYHAGEIPDPATSMWKDISAHVAAIKDPAWGCYPPAADQSAPSDPCGDVEKAILTWLAKSGSNGPAGLYQNVVTTISSEPNVQNDSSRHKLIAQYAAEQTSIIAADKQFEADVKNLQAGWNGALTFTEQYPTTGATTTTTTTSTTTTTTTTPSAPAYLVSGLNISWQKKTPDPQSSATDSGAGKAAGGTTSAKDSTSASPVPSWTLNLAGSVYPNPIAALNEQTFRGGTAATTFQWDLGKSPFLASTVDKSQITLELSGQYQRIQENQGQKGKKADLALGNLKLEFPISSGVSFPLSITVANSSEQIKQTYVKGNFGISFDLDKLASLLKAKQTTQ